MWLGHLNVFQQTPVEGQSFYINQPRHLIGCRRWWVAMSQLQVELLLNPLGLGHIGTAEEILFSVKLAGWTEDKKTCLWPYMNRFSSFTNQSEQRKSKHIPPYTQPIWKGGIYCILRGAGTGPQPDQNTFGRNHKWIAAGRGSKNILHSGNSGGWQPLTLLKYCLVPS